MIGEGINIDNPKHYSGCQHYSNDDDEVEDDMSLEHALGEHAEWKKIQQNTFTRWANERLKITKMHIDNMETDLADGIRLITLVQVLSGKQLPKHNKHPSFRSQKLENVSLVLKFLEETENIRIVNIDSSDIVDCKLKLIFGLIWTLIVHYSISMPMFLGESTHNENTEPSPKQRLLQWIQNKLPHLGITNFTSDWKNGKAVGALVDAIAPGLCPDWENWNDKDSLINASEAMSLAEDCLNVPQLIKPEEIVNPNVDEQSMMTYLSQYPNAKLKPGILLEPRANPTRVRVFGSGVEPKGLIIGIPANFYVETFGAGKGTVDVQVEDPKGRLEPTKCYFNNDKSLTYSVSYLPKIPGEHKISVKYSGREVPRSPFIVQVDSKAGDASKVTASGPGLKTDGVLVNEPTFFDIYTQNAGNGVPEVIILDPMGVNDTIPVSVRQSSPDIWRCQYTPNQIGLHSVNIFFAGDKIPNNPFGVKVVPISDPRKATASGRGLQAKGVRVNDQVDFNVYTKGAGEGQVGVRINGPGGIEVPCKIKKCAAHKYNVTYQPIKEGRYIVIITFAGEEIPKSPYQVNVSPYKESLIKAYGPGLVGGVSGYPALFVVETNGETGPMDFSICGPSNAKIDCFNNGDGSADVRYHPTVPGEYAVRILCNNEDIPNSPYIAQILPESDYQPDKVLVHGPGVEQHEIYKSVPISFTIDPRATGSAPIDVKVSDANRQNVDVLLTENPDRTVTAQYTPKIANVHTVEVNYGGVACKKSPFRIPVLEATNHAFSSVSCYGDGLKDGVRTKVPTHFRIDARKAEIGDVDLKLLNESTNRVVPVEITDHSNGFYTVDYEPTEPGTHVLYLKYGGEVVTGTPVKFEVVPNIDISKIKVHGLEQTVPVNSLQQFRVITPDAGKAEFAISITTPSGSKVKALVIPTHEGYLVNFTPTQLGEYLLGISFGGEPLTQKPYKITCLTGSDSNKVKASGPGLHQGVVYKPAEFIIDTRGAGQGGLGVTIEGPCEAAINCRDNGDGTCSVAYLPTEIGDYDINITFNDSHIPGSPYQALIVPEVDVDKITVSGFGVQLHGVYVNSQTDFLVDTRGLSETDDADAKVKCTITNPSGAQTNKVVTPMNDGTYNVSYTPFEEGRHTIEILYDNVPVPGSPFVVNVHANGGSDKAAAYGPGLEEAIVDKYNFFKVENRSADVEEQAITIHGPTETKLFIQDNHDGTCSVQYLPTTPGEYHISVKSAGIDIAGSPFKVLAEYDNAVRVYGPLIETKCCRANVPTEFTIDTSKSQSGPISVNVQTDQGALKPKVTDFGNGINKVKFVPPNDTSHLNVHIKHRDQEIECSPLEVKVLPNVQPDKIKVNLADRGVPASLPTAIKIDTNEAGNGALEVNIIGPDGRSVPVKLVDNEDGTYNAVFVPDDCGRYIVDIKYAGEKIPGCPFTTQAHSTGSAKKCKITEEPKRNLSIGEEYCVTVNTENAGIGAVTCKVRATNGGSDLDINIVDNGDGTVSIYYNVRDSGDYTINIKFGGNTVPGGFYTFRAEETRKTEETIYSKTTTRKRVISNSSQTTTTSSTQSGVFRKVHLQRIPLAATGGLVEADIKMPSGNVDKPVIEDNHDGTVSIKYDPREEGLHELAVKYNGDHIQGSPFHFHVDNISSGYVTAYGPGLTHGVTGEPSNFTISTKGAGLTSTIEGPSKVEITYHDNKDGTFLVSYLPTAPGEYKITVKTKDGKEIKGSPFTAKITGEGRKRNQISLGTCSNVSLPGKITDAEMRSFNACIQAPSGLEEPCFIKRFPTGNIGISFTPREVGEHVVSVKKLGKHIPNSPFKIQVREQEVGDAKKVVVSGTALKEGKTQVKNVFTVDTREAGFGGLSLSIEGPSRAQIETTDKEDGTNLISYLPTEPGYYIINLKFADHHVDGSPFTVKVSGEGTNRQREKIQRQREAVPLTEVGSQCKLTFKMPGITSFDLSGSVTSPGGVMEDAIIKEVQDGLYAVHFVPKELGVHTVSVKYKDIHIPGSPFQFTVGPWKDSGSHLVKAGGAGLERGEQGAVNEFNVWTREAGKGKLVISVEGPSRAEINFTDRKDGSCEVAYKVSEPGEYRVGLKFNDEHVPDSPFKVYISPAVGDAHLLEVAQFPEGVVQADKPSQFMVRKNGAKGDLDAKIIGPSGHEEDCFIQLVDLEEYSVRFMPRENGIHKIHSKFNGVHIPGSPFSIRVGKDTADPAAVHAAGPGLGDIKTGVKTDFIIDTVNAGTGTLAVTIDGTSKVSMDCTEVEEGYKVRYTPLAPGDYFISIKYNNNHIVGSPFRVHSTGNSNVVDIGSQETNSVVVDTVAKVGKSISQGPKLPKFKSDASKITSKGMGLKKAYLGKQNQFTVSANDAGANFLFVGIHGPKGPCDEVNMKHTGREQYTVNYLVRDRGDYIIIVKWGDENIPGSPFKVEV